MFGEYGKFSPGLLGSCEILSGVSKVACEL